MDLPYIIQVQKDRRDTRMIKLSKGETEVLDFIINEDLNMTEIAKKLGHKTTQAAAVRLTRLRIKNEYNSNYKLFYEMGRASVKAMPLTAKERQFECLTIIDKMIQELLNKTDANTGK